jgi:hypothetical protein
MSQVGPKTAVVKRVTESLTYPGITQQGSAMNRDSHKFGRRLSVASLALLLMFAMSSPARAGIEPRVIGGSPGHPWSAASVAIEMPGESSCTGALWKPRIVVSAAHCFVDEDTGRVFPAASLKVWAPGANWKESPPAPVQVMRIDFDRTWTSFDESGSSGDIAFLVLSAPLGTPIISRMASPTEVSAMAGLGMKVTYIGYGLTGPEERDDSDDSAVPLSVELTLVEADLDDGTVELVASATNGVCEGDSGGPFLAQLAGEILLVANFSAMSGPPCTPSDGGNKQEVDAVISSADRSLIRTALAEAGEVGDVMPTTCIQGPNVERSCSQGRAWEYDYCWSGRRAVLQERVNGRWTRVAVTSASRTNLCPRAAPFAVEFIGITDPGVSNYRIVLPRQRGLPRGAQNAFTVRSS